MIGTRIDQIPRNYLYRRERIRSLRVAGDQTAEQAEVALLKQYGNLPADRLKAFLAAK